MSSHFVKKEKRRYCTRQGKGRQGMAWVLHCAVLCCAVLSCMSFIHPSDMTAFQREWGGWVGEEGVETNATLPSPPPLCFVKIPPSIATMAFRLLSRHGKPAHDMDYTMDITRIHTWMDLDLRSWSVVNKHP